MIHSKLICYTIIIVFKMFYGIWSVSEKFMFKR